MNGGTITSETPGLMLINNGSTTINGGNIEDIYSRNNVYMIENNIDSTLTINGGTFKKKFSDKAMIYNKGTLSIIDGNFDTSGGAYSCGYNTCYQATTFINNTGTTTITGGSYTTSTINDKKFGILFNNSGTLSISDITCDFERFGTNSGTINLNNVTMNNLKDSGLENTGTATITGGQYKMLGTAYLIYSNGNSNLTLNNTNLSTTNSNYSMISFKSSGIFNISNSELSSTINSYLIDFSIGTLNINSGTISSVGPTVSMFSGNLNINGGTMSSSNSNTISTSGGTVNIIDGEVTSKTGSAVYNSGEGTINIGEKGLPIKEVPRIEGLTYAVYNTNSNGKINIYDGTLIGGTDSTYGVLNEYEPNYRVVTNDEVIDGVTKKVGRLKLIGETERVAVVNSINFSDLQSAVNYSANSGNADITLYKNVTLERDLVNPGSGNIRILVGNYTITKGSYSIDSTITLIDSNGNPVTAAIYKFLANILNIEVNPRNIVIYMMSDGSKLTDEETYKLYKEDKLVTFNNIETGKYKLGNNVEEIGTVNNRIYIEGLGEGSYKLVSSTNKEVTFEITKDKVLGNVREYTIENENRKTSEAVAEYIIQIQTGINRVNYLLIIISILVSVLSLIIINKKKSIKI